MGTATKRPSGQRYTKALKEALLAMLPEQGCWSEERYLDLTDSSNPLVELTDGVLEFLPTPTDRHQAILEFLFEAFREYITPRNGLVRFAGIRLRIRPDEFREPDLILIKDADDPRRQNRYWTGADLVVEVVSPDSEERDMKENARTTAKERCRSIGLSTRRTAASRYSCCTARATSSSALFATASQRLPEH